MIMIIISPSRIRRERAHVGQDLGLREGEQGEEGPAEEADHRNVVLGDLNNKKEKNMHKIGHNSNNNHNNSNSNHNNYSAAGARWLPKRRGNLPLPRKKSVREPLACA